ncbi:MAG: ABC transporter ATP-binding protein [Pyrinomonadaceae bacterium]|nr:ABC transporter ATP-binding protein [Pyrinomonadaceae bacterium]
MTSALRVEGVSKQYRIYDRPGDRLKESLTRGRWKAHREFWALRDVSFDVARGTTTGIVGPNGCGKSTLLQIIAGTLEPTHGHVWRDGRVSALLELGAGFNPEFTGVENVTMNAALMGFSHRETEAMLPEIERFAEVGDFIHQPVRTYSSGMYVRLAFAAAVSVAPQILIIDEALAVGDAVFQHRCMRRLREMQQSGVTILFVSHDPGAVRALCSRAVLLGGGRVVADGKPAEILNRYQKIIMAREQAYEESQLAAEDESGGPAVDLSSAASLRHAHRHGDGSAEILSVELLDAEGRPAELVESGERLLIRKRVAYHRDAELPVSGCVIRNRHGVHVYGTNTDLLRADVGRVRRGEVIEVAFAFDCWLAPGSYSLTVAEHSVDGISFDWIDDVLIFHVSSETSMDGVANLNASVTTRRVGVLPIHAKVANVGAGHALKSDR